MADLETNVSVPVLDDPINESEMKSAFKDMKKAGYDIHLPILDTLVTYFSITLLMMLNFMFYVKYPVQLSLSLLSLIPKAGNLALSNNYRGIQMMKSLACLFDRIITNRLKLWLPFHIDQTAFQKLKSTLLHIFTLRILIELAKKNKTTLYIGSMDLSKAFDNVDRLLLLKKLIKLGVGKYMLHALKQLYRITNCIIQFGGEFSSVFPMHSGIRQGAASSVLLFNSFMDDLFKHLGEGCATETLLQDIHTLIHADDTIILSTCRQKFIHKCNMAIDFFHSNKLKLNIGKCKYTVINPGKNDKTSLILKGGTLKYTNTLKYLGIYITSSGSIRSDVKYYLDKLSYISTIDYPNFCKLNKNAPLHIKLLVLDKCVVSSLIYACEVWGNHYRDVEPIYRCCIKTALGIRPGTNNEIVYIEAGKHPLEGRIKSLQHKFWSKMINYTNDNPDSAIAKVLRAGRACNLSYL